MWVVRVVCAGLPALQTLMLASYEPETILSPSLLKVTDLIMLLCAFCFSAWSSSVSANST